MLISVASCTARSGSSKARRRRPSTRRAEVSARRRRSAKEPPSPNLQTQPFKDVYQLRQGENEKLTSYGWVDKDGGVTRIPIDRAMEVMLQRGFPARADGGNGAERRAQDSSSGRTMVPR